MKFDKTYLDLAVITGGELALKLVSYVIFVLLARFILPKDDMGLLFGGIAIGTLAVIVCEIGTTRYLLRAISEDHSLTERLLSEVFGLRLILTFFVWAGITLIYCFNNPAEAMVISMAVGFCLLEGLFYAFSATLLAHRMVLTRVLCMAIAPLLVLVGMLIAIGMGWGLYGVLGCFMVSYAAMVVVTMSVVRVKLSPVKPSFSMGRHWVIARESFPLALLMLISMAYFKADTIMLLKMRSNESVATYEAGYKLFEVSRVMIRPAINVITPIISLIIVQNRWPKLRSLTLKVLGGCFVVGLALGVVVIPLADWLVVMVFGPEYADSGPVVKILFAATIPLFIGFSATMIASLMRLDRQAVWLSLICLVGNVLANLYAIPRWGEIGAAWTTLFSEIVLSILAVTLVFWYIRQRQRLSDAEKLPGPIEPALV